MACDRSSEQSFDALESAVRESRTVLDHQIELVARMDDIAMHTLRSSVLVIGVLASAAGIGGPSVIEWMPPLALGLFALGFLLLFGSVIAGLVALSMSSLSLGISDSHRRLLRQQSPDRREWTLLLLDEYGSWSREMERTVAENALWLQYVLWTFFGGIVCLSGATGVMTIQVVG